MAPTHKLTIDHLLKSNSQWIHGEKDTEEMDQWLIIDDTECQGPVNEWKKLVSMVWVLEMLKAEQIQDLGPSAKCQEMESSHLFS